MMARSPMDTIVDYILFLRNYDSTLSVNERRARNKAAFEEVLPRLEYLGLHMTRLDETYGALFMRDSRETVERTFQIQFVFETKNEPLSNRVFCQIWEPLTKPIIPQVLCDFISELSFFNM
jgi:hypothetical protein